MADAVLAHIAGSITQKVNLATEALAFVLNRSPTARSACQRQLAALVGEFPGLARVTTQVRNHHQFQRFRIAERRLRSV